MLTRRNGAITCSPRCRTWRSRHPEHRAEVQAVCERLDVPLPHLLEIKATATLRPDLLERLANGEPLDIDYIRRETVNAYVRAALSARTPKEPT